MGDAVCKMKVWSTGIKSGLPVKEEFWTQIGPISIRLAPFNNKNAKNLLNPSNNITEKR